MRILINDKMQYASGAPSEIKSPALSDIYEDEITFDIGFSYLEKIDCIGIGFTDATSLSISNGVGTESISITKDAPYQNGLYLINSMYNILDLTTVQQTEAETNTWTSVCWSPALSLFCAVARAGAGDNYVMTSPDGVTWTARAATEKNSWQSVCWSPELAIFCAVASTGTNRVMTSADGITWTARSASSVSYWTSVCWSPELTLFCAVSFSGTYKVMTSPDGITWTDRSSVSATAWYSVCWSPELNLFCAVGTTETYRVMTSPDGITWTGRTAAEQNQWYSVCWSPELNLFCAVADFGTSRVMTSPDGITWTASLSSEQNSWYSVCWSPEYEIFYAVAATGTNKAMVSYDGTTWTAYAVAGINYWVSVCWSPDLGIFCGVAESSSDLVFICEPDYDAFTISHNGTYIGRVGIGENRKLGTSISKEIGFYDTSENRTTLSGQVLPGAGGYSGRRFEADVRYKIDSDVYDDIEAAYSRQIMKGYPYFLLLDDEQHKLPANMLHFYASTQEPISLLQSSIYNFLYSYKFSFYEKF